MFHFVLVQAHPLDVVPAATTAAAQMVRDPLLNLAHVLLNLFPVLFYMFVVPVGKFNLQVSGPVAFAAVSSAVSVGAAPHLVPPPSFLPTSVLQFTFTNTPILVSSPVSWVFSRGFFFDIIHVPTLLCGCRF